MPKKKRTAPKIPKLRLRRTSDNAPTPESDNFVSNGAATPSPPPQELAPSELSQARADLAERMAPLLPPGFVKEKVFGTKIKNARKRVDGSLYKSVHLHLDLDLYQSFFGIRGECGGTMKSHINTAIRAYVDLYQCLFGSRVEREGTMEFHINKAIREYVEGFESDK